MYVGYTRHAVFDFRLHLNYNLFFSEIPGTKGDLRCDEKEDIISLRDCKKMRDKIRASKYVECSAVNQEGLEEVFVEAIRAVLKKPSSRKLCCIL